MRMKMKMRLMRHRTKVRLLSIVFPVSCIMMLCSMVVLLTTLAIGAGAFLTGWDISWGSWIGVMSWTSPVLVVALFTLIPSGVMLDRLEQRGIEWKERVKRERREQVYRDTGYYPNSGDFVSYQGNRVIITNDWGNAQSYMIRGTGEGYKVE